MKGTYILAIYISDNEKIDIGALGRRLFHKGYYLYIGSAMGTNGPVTLENRINRHISPSQNKKIHWHIDYLLKSQNSFIYRLYIIPSLLRLECTIAREIAEISDNNIKDFGSSDCVCSSHLFYFREFKSLQY
jgi:Uri superfamily endonuclease